MPEIHSHDNAIVNPETQHETSDVSIRALLWFFVIFIAFGFFSYFAISWLYKGFAGVVRRRQETAMTGMQRPADMDVPRNQPLLQPFPQAAQNGRILPPNRSTPVADLAEMRNAEQRTLTSYAWVDRQKGIVRIPIGEAMRLTLERGLPVQTGGAQPTSAVTQTAAPVAPSAAGAHP